MAERHLTHLEMHKLVLDSIDEAGTPRWDKIQVARRLNMAYADWLKTTCKRALEKDEAARRELGPLTITVPETMTGNTLNLTTIEPTVYRIMGVSATWNRIIVDRCRRRKQRVDTWPVNPIRYDQLATAKKDPWNKPTDEKGRYTETKRKQDDDRPLLLVLHTTTTPNSLELTYVHEPEKIDILKAPNGRTEVGYDTQLELIRRAAAMLLTPDENYQAAQAQYGEIQISNA